MSSHHVSSPSRLSTRPLPSLQRDDYDDEPLPTTPRESLYMRGHSSSVFPSLGGTRRQSSNENYIEMLDTPRTPPTSASRRQTTVPGESRSRSVAAPGTTSQRPTRPAAMSSDRSSSSREQPSQDRAASHGAAVGATSGSRHQHGGARRGMHLPLLGSQQGPGSARQSMLYPNQDSPVTTSTHFPAQPRGGGDVGVGNQRLGEAEVAFIGEGGGGSDTDGEGVGATAPRMPGSGAWRNYRSVPASVPRSGVATVPVGEALAERPDGGGDLLTLNVGGQLFSTTQTTLLSDPESMLAVLLQTSVGKSRDSSGAIFIDRDPTHFGLILNFLRDGDAELPADSYRLGQLIREASYYQLNELAYRAELRRRKVKRDIISRETLLMLLHSSTRLHMPSTAFCGLNLGHLNLREAVLIEADFAGASLRGANLEAAECCGASFKSAVLMNSRLSGADLRNADFSKANLRKAQLNRALLRGAKFTKADLTRTNLQDCDLRGCSFEGACMQRVVFMGNVIIGIDFSGIDLEGANFEGATLEDVKLDGCNLRHANFWGARLTRCSTENANMRDANLQNVRFEDTPH